MYMSSPLNQVHILIPKKELQHLKAKARQERKSVAALIRHAIERTYGTVAPDQRQAAFQRLAARNELAMGNWDEVKQELLRRYD